MSDDAGAASDDAEFQRDADRVYEELLARVGEAQPRLRLEPTRRAAELLGEPQRSAPVVHITGTNGKTSTSRMIESLLRATGLRPGLLTSPHLIRVNERIMIDGDPITNEALVRNWDDIQPYLLMVDTELEGEGESPLTFFEALTLLAFASFADAPVDVIILEVGMGGEWDSTNVADGQVAVFTPIALDHHILIERDRAIPQERLDRGDGDRRVLRLVIPVQREVDAVVPTGPAPDVDQLPADRDRGGLDREIHHLDRDVRLELCGGGAQLIDDLDRLHRRHDRCGRLDDAGLRAGDLLHRVAEPRR
ncbi:MAG TPA: Mur ligase family protein, partial [Solirubrobacteraceae bacterium]|nr:Mur ligase family protein [Solirubrobacteraceae bacterium]